jgi:hypothetical protein
LLSLVAYMRLAFLNTFKHMLPLSCIVHALTE